MKVLWNSHNLHKEYNNSCMKFSDSVPKTLNTFHMLAESMKYDSKYNTENNRHGTSIKYFEKMMGM